MSGSSFLLSRLLVRRACVSVPTLQSTFSPFSYSQLPLVIIINIPHARLHTTSLKVLSFFLKNTRKSVQGFKEKWNLSQRRKIIKESSEDVKRLGIFLWSILHDCSLGPLHSSHLGTSLHSSPLLDAAFPTSSDFLFPSLIDFLRRK